MKELSFNDSKYSRDEINLQIIFPEDVWILIFNKLKESSAYNCIDVASPYFHKLLMPLRTRILFPEVTEICIHSMLFTHELYFTLLKCRSACKTWKRGVETAFHHILSETNTDGKSWRNFCCDVKSPNCDQLGVIERHNTYDICKQNKLDKFLDFFHNSHFLTGSNPFPTRSIGFDICSDFSTQKILEIPQIYGHHIWHCYVRLWFKNPEEQQQVLFLCELLGLLPNLQTLRISTVEECDENRENLKPNLTALSMPKLKSLKLLACIETPQPIVSELIQNNPHIKSLRLSELDFSSSSEYLPTPLPNLEEFHISGIKSTQDFLDLQTAQVQWQLTKLTFCFDCYSYESQEINPVFNWIEAKWSDTLKELNIHIPLPGFFSETEPLNLPNLTTLRIEMGCYACLDFILPLSKSLVYLSVRHAVRDEYHFSLEIDSKIKFFKHMNNLGKSNIWKFFPRLREISYADEKLHYLRNGSVYRRNHWVGFSLEGI